MREPVPVVVVRHFGGKRAFLLALYFAHICLILEQRAGWFVAPNVR